MIKNPADGRHRIYFRRLCGTKEASDGKMVVTLNSNDNENDVPTDKGRYTSVDTVKQHLLNDEGSNLALNRMDKQWAECAVAFDDEVHVLRFKEPTEVGQFRANCEVPERVG